MYCVSEGVLVELAYHWEGGLNSSERRSREEFGQSPVPPLGRYRLHDYRLSH